MALLIRYIGDEGYYTALLCYDKPQTDSTIAPPPRKKPAFFFNERFMAARYKEGYTIEYKVSMYFLVCKGLC